MKKWKSNNYEIFKNTRVIQKNALLKKKLINEEGIIISDLCESPGGIFAATLIVGLVFTSHTLQNLQNLPYIML